MADTSTTPTQRGNSGAAILPYLQWGLEDPTVVATAGTPGSLFLRIPSDGRPPTDIGLYMKITDEGQNTSWQLLSSGGGGGSDAIDGLYFVAENGNDGTGDGSLSKPFLTIQAAITKAVADGHGFSAQAEVLVLPSSTPYAGFTTANGVNVKGLHGDRSGTQINTQVILSPSAAGVTLNSVEISNLTINVTGLAVPAVTLVGANAGEFKLRNCHIVGAAGQNCVNISQAGSVVYFDNVAVEALGALALDGLHMVSGFVIAINNSSFFSPNQAVSVAAAASFQAHDCVIQSTGGTTIALNVQGFVDIWDSEIINSSAAIFSLCVVIGATGTANLTRVSLSAAGANLNYSMVAGGVLNQSLVSLIGASKAFTNLGTQNNVPILDVGLGNQARVRDALDPVLPQDYATKAYVDTSIGGATNRETFILTAPDIAAGFVDLAFVVTHDSVIANLQGAALLLETSDYTLSDAAVTRLTFDAGLIPGLAVGQILQVQYTH